MAGALTETHADAAGAAFAASAGCPASGDVAAGLRALPVDKILATQGGTNSPIVNGTTLDEQLLTSFAKGHVKDVSAILGVNRDEDLTGTATTPAAYRSLIRTHLAALYGQGRRTGDVTPACGRQ